MAGTDAMALGSAIDREIPAQSIPAYIKANKGLEELLRADRSRRDPWEIIEIAVRRGVRRRLDAFQLRARAPAIIMRSRVEKPAGPKFAIIQLK